MAHPEIYKLFSCILKGIQESITFGGCKVGIFSFIHFVNGFQAA